MFSGVCLSTGGVMPAPGGACSRSGVPVGEPLQDGHCCGWYASYWNAFLCVVIVLLVGYFFLSTRKQSLGQGNVFKSVCLLGVVGFSPLDADQLPPWMQSLLNTDPPMQKLPPPTEIHGILRDTVNMWAVSILLDYILVFSHFGVDISPLVKSEGLFTRTLSVPVSVSHHQSLILCQL